VAAQVKIGILETGRPPEVLIPEFGTYADMFARTLAPQGAQVSVYDVPAGELPARPEDQDAYLITGSAAGAYEDLPWIAPLKGFLVEAKGRAKLVGICFGHQLMAEAFGGKVIKSPKGWGLGLQTYEVREREPWMDGAAAISVAASHQDQVIELPPGARVVAGDAFAPYAILAYDDQPAISVQPHPEWDPNYAIALIERRLETVLNEAQGRAAMETLKRPNDHARVAGWVRTFLEA
jgi:GMP synthase-like glutamine amidotransferase